MDSCIVKSTLKISMKNSKPLEKIVGTNSILPIKKNYKENKKYLTHIITKIKTNPDIPSLELIFKSSKSYFI